VGALFATAAAFACAALTLARPFGRTGSRAATKASVVRQAWEGLRYLAANRMLRALAVSGPLVSASLALGLAFAAAACVLAAALAYVAVD
jgi:hypothetical protein